MTQPLNPDIIATWKQLAEEANDNELHGLAYYADYRTSKLVESSRAIVLALIAEVERLSAGAAGDGR